MSVKLEQIDQLRERAHVTYEEAREALESCNGDMVEALVYLERQQKIKAQNQKKSSEGYGIIRAIKNLIKKGNRTKLVVQKRENVVIGIPVTLAVIFTVLAPYLTLIGVVIALFTDHKFAFVRQDGTNADVNKMLCKVSSAVDAAKAKFSEEGLTTVEKK
jgi:hypothetical protein